MIRILLVDDDNALREMVSRELSLSKIYVKALSNGSKVVSEIKNENYDLIITDIVMPDKEGIETIRDIRQVNSTIPIIAVSGGGPMTADMILDMAMMMGANSILIKPFDTNTLINKIKEILGIYS